MKTDRAGGDIKTLLTLLVSLCAPYCGKNSGNPGFEKTAAEQSWPAFDESKTIDTVKEIAVQVFGKFKTTITAPADAEDSFIITAACSDEKSGGSWKEWSFPKQSS